MRICYLTSYYPPFVDTLLAKFKNFDGLSYQQTLDLILAELFADTGSIYFYSKQYGNDAHIIIQNIEILQKKWAEENNVLYSEQNWSEEIALEQVRKWNIEVFYTESIQGHSTFLLDEVKRVVKLVVAWISFPFETLPNLNKIDLIFTSTKHYRAKFRNLNLDSEYMLPAFDSRILERLNKEKKSIPFSFIGGISEVHKRRWEALNYLCEKSDVKLWGYGLPKKSGNALKRLIKNDPYSKIRNKHQGELWGIEMYQVLRDSLISFNIHEDLLKGDVGNMRMFEATGVATALLNDEGNNLKDLFVPEKEIIVYRSLQEAIEKLEFYLQNPDLAIEIGKNAQLRTLKDYNYPNYTIQMMDFIKKRLN